MELKEYRSFYYDSNHAILADITKIASTIFGEGIVKKVLYEFEKYYPFADNEIYIDYKDFINKNYDELTENLKSFINHGITTNNNGKPYMDIDGEILIVEFADGSMIKFSTSEWGRIDKLK